MKYLIISFLLLSSTFLPAQDSLQIITIREARVSPAFVVQKPVMSDMVNIFGDKFDSKQTMKTQIPRSAYTKNTQLVQADAESEYLFAGEEPVENTSLYFFNFNVTAQRFCKAKLKVYSPQMIEIYVDDEKVTDKKSTQKSLDKAASADWNWKLEPRSYTVAVKCLAQEGDSLRAAVKITIEPDNKEDLAFIAAGAEQQKRPFTLGDVMNGERPGGVSISPDGKYVIMHTSNTLPKGRTTRSSKIVELATDKVLWSGDDRGWSWMPKGSRLYYTAQGENGRNLIVVDFPSLSENVLVEGLPEGYFRWSPDESFLIFSITDRAPDSNDGGVKQILSPQDRQAGWRNRSFIHKFDIEAGILQPLVFGYRGAYLNAISPDAKSLIFSTRKDNYTERPFGLTSIYRLNLENMQIDTLWNDIKYGGVACFSPDGKQLLLTGGPEAFDNIGRAKEVNDMIPNSYDTQAYVYTFADKSIKPITLNFNPSIGSTFWSKTDNNIYFTVTDEDYTNCYRYLTRRNRIEKIEFPVDVIQNLSFAAESLNAVGTGQSVSYPSIVYKVDLQNGKTSILADPLKPMMEQLQIGKVENWDFKSSRGDVIKGRIYYPPNFDKSKKYPAIVYYYGGTTPVNRTFDGRYPFHVYACQGYIVYVLQPSGTIGFGQEFSARHVNAWGDYTADDIIEGTKKLCDEHPFVNREKIGCLGASYGGFMTMYLQTRTDIFAAAASHAGISDITSYWGEGYWGYSYNAAAAADSYPWSNQELFVKNSPLYSADKINTPLLLLHGDVDTNVPPGESIQMFTALKILGKEVALVTVEGENHHIMDYNKRIKWNNTIFAWFAKWLQDNDTWWNEMYPQKNY